MSKIINSKWSGPLGHKKVSKKERFEIGARGSKAAAEEKWKNLTIQEK